MSHIVSTSLPHESDVSDHLQASKRRKVAYRIPEAEFDPEQSSPALDVLELADIRREYSLTLARLELSIEYPELERTRTFHGVCSHTLSFSA